MLLAVNEKHNENCFGRVDVVCVHGTDKLFLDESICI